MPKQTRSTRALPPSATNALETLGADLAFARKRRGWSLREAAGRLFITVTTLRRLEAGHPGVGLGVLAQAMNVYGLGDRLALLANPSFDLRALQQERRRLTTRVGQKDDFDV